jgi:hypothetical protein
LALSRPVRGFTANLIPSTRLDKLRDVCRAMAARIQTAGIPAAHGSGVMSVAFSPTGDVIAAGGGVHRWNPQSSVPPGNAWSAFPVHLRSEPVAVPTRGHQWRRQYRSCRPRHAGRSTATPRPYLSTSHRASSGCWSKPRKRQVGCLAGCGARADPPGAALPPSQCLRNPQSAPRLYFQVFGWFMVDKRL